MITRSPSASSPSLLLSRLIIPFFCILLGWWLVVPAAGGEKQTEKPYALIFGTVWGPEGQPMYAVRIKIRRADQKKAKWELYSDHHGEFAQRVPAGVADYLVSADLKGYKAQNGKQLRLSEEVKVHLDNDERVDIGVHLTY